MICFSRPLLTRRTARISLSPIIPHTRLSIVLNQVIGGSDRRVRRRPITVHLSIIRRRVVVIRIRACLQIHSSSAQRTVVHRRRQSAMGIVVKVHIVEVHPWVVMVMRRGMIETGLTGMIRLE